ncbi:MAG: hypothetical protein M1828_007245 [Chrysothrix sp. TS-e1954]|nr:MAG: hypothetical protein M1828_007245 [Chrysothrix sp. TS-e1954]
MRSLPASTPAPAGGDFASGPTSKAMGIVQRPFTFLKLPVEIRTMVYRQLLIHHRGFVRLFDRNMPAMDQRKPPRIHNSVLRICRQVHDEAVRVLYSENTFILLPSLRLSLSCEQEHKLMERRAYVRTRRQHPSDRALGTMGQINRALIRKVEILLPHPHRVMSRFGVLPARCDIKDSDFGVEVLNPTKEHYFEVYNAMLPQMPSSAKTFFHLSRHYGCPGAEHTSDGRFLSALEQVLGHSPRHQRSLYWLKQSKDEDQWSYRRARKTDWLLMHGVDDEDIDELTLDKSHYDEKMERIHVALYHTIGSFAGALDDESDSEDFDEDEEEDDWDEELLHWCDDRGWEMCHKCDKIVTEPVPWLSPTLCQGCEFMRSDYDDSSWLHVDDCFCGGDEILHEECIQSQMEAQMMKDRLLQHPDYFDYAKQKHLRLTEDDLDTFDEHKNEQKRKNWEKASQSHVKETQVETGGAENKPNNDTEHETDEVGTTAMGIPTTSRQEA